VKIDQIFNDLNLSLASLLLIALWVATQTIWKDARGRRETMAVTFLRMICGLLLAGASLDKLGDAAGFSKIILECYNFFPRDLVPLAAVVIPWFEFFTGLCLMAGFRWRGAAFVFCALMALYSLAIFWDLLHGIDCNCGCFNKDSTEKMTWLTLARDLLFFGMGWITLTASKTFAALDGWRNPNRS
jgi:putative oxidoreductase